MLISFPIVMIGLGRFYSLLVFPLLVMMGPVAFILSELLYSRLLYALPSQTAHMVAGEIQHRTWDVLLSTPIPRYQIILSKVSAQFWSTEPALLPVIVSRMAFVGFVVVEGLAFRREAPALTTVLNLSTLGLLIALMPALELYAFTGLGILISYLAHSVSQATLANWGLWILYRIGTAVLLLTTYVEPSTEEWMTYLGLLLFFPHWAALVVLILGWGFAAPNPYWLTFSSIYVFLPLTIGTLGLILTIHLLQRR